MSTSQQLELDLSDEGFDVDAFARALSFYPTMTSIQAYFLGGQAGESFLDWWDEVRDGPRPDYYAMQEDGPVLQVINGQMGIDVWVDDSERPTRTYWFPLPRTFNEAFNRLLEIEPDFWEESNRDELWDDYRVERLKGLMRWMMKIPAHVH